MSRVGMGVLGGMAMFAAMAVSAADTSSATASTASTAKAEAASATETAPHHSPWLLVPLLSSSPKLGTSFGGMGGYVTRFDEASSPSLIAVQAMRSNTSSDTIALGGKLFFNNNSDRVIFGVAGGKVTNDYLDFLGTGAQVRSEEDIKAFFIRYQHEVAEHLFLGVQALKANYGVDGLDPTSDFVLDQAGLTGTKSAGLGLVLSYDTRDDVNNPGSGVYWQIHNLAYREGLGSDANYDALNADLQWYTRTSDRNVLIFHGQARWTHDAPASRESSILMRGYTTGQYLGKYSLTAEVEDRYMFSPRWGGKAFSGVACLYGGGQSCSGDNLYPMAGVGAFYIIKPKENMLVTAEFAKGSGENQGFYLHFGHRF